MQFIQNGPDVPDRLLQAHEEGKVVFFCGAGVSYPAGLPGFGGLVSKLYDAFTTSPTDVEKAAIRNGQFDTAIGLLEARIRGGREVVRQTIATILTPADLTRPKTTATHRALLDLSRTKSGHYRLITTNFDRIFESFAGPHILRAAAPRLPIPKNKWNGLVYLHGLLPERPTAADLDALVVSSGDFGLAYLIERWAARFVSELFRNYTVCFVGYSINDPVLRYMMDALAADRMLGETTFEAFAFGSFSKGREDEQRVEWAAKNVTPILYRAHAKHFYFHSTLSTWAAHYRDGISGNERIVSRHASSPPTVGTKQDDLVGRVLWALTDPSGVPAKQFAELDPVPPIDWLDALADDRFGYRDLPRFGIRPKEKEDEALRFSLISRYANYNAGRSMKLVFDHDDARPWDPVMHQLARWILRHLNNPRLLLWVADRGGRLHPALARLISAELGSAGPHISPPMRKLWSLLLAGRIRS